MHPSLYKLWILFERSKSALRTTSGKGIVGESPHFERAACEIESRGFDVVIFGRSHHWGQVTLPGGGSYFNPGSWMISSHYVKIERDEVSLCVFSDGVN